ncbi:MAG: hypothetical protein EA397_04835 [Deltaproteobacteria bacterium]|nr:MAG: hypothetical protein EA397_04835 [Deltaproteobacteria bacterium]
MSTASPTPDGALQSPVEIATESINVLMDNVGPLLMAILAQVLSVFVASFVIVPLSICCLYGCMIGSVPTGMAVGAVLHPLLGDGGAGTIGALITTFMFIGSFVLFYGILIVGLLLVVAPISGGTLRVIDEHLRGVSEASFGAVFKKAGEQPAKDIFSNGIFSVALLVGMLFCYIGALIPAVLLMWFPFACELDGKSIREGLTRSIRILREQPGWVLTTFAVGFVANMVAGMIPLLGPLYAIVFMVRCYRVAFPAETEGDSEVTVPVGA